MSLQSSSEFTVLDASIEVTSVTLSILPVAAPGEGTGRLTHPTLGTYDYAMAPERWTNMDGDAIRAPVWAGERALEGHLSTLWHGHIEDVVVEERWLGRAGAAMPFEQLRMFIGMWQNPPDPEDDYILWSPSYVNGHTYQVILEDLTVGSGGIELSHLALKNDLVQDPVTLQIRMVSRVEA